MVERFHKGEKFKIVQCSRTFSSPVSIIIHIYIEVTHKSLLSVLCIAHRDCLDLCKMLSLLIMMDVIVTDHGTTRGGCEGQSLAADVFLSLEKVGTNDRYFAKWELLSLRYKEEALLRETLYPVPSLGA